MALGIKEIEEVSVGGSRSGSGSVSGSGTLNTALYLSDDCTWSYHINKMTGDARKMASWVLGAFRDRSILTMILFSKHS